MHTNVLIEKLQNGELDSRLLDIYVDKKQLNYQRKRYIDAIKRFEKLYSPGFIKLFSAPGRSEVGGNHTDHQQGTVLAASINLDNIAVVKQTSDRTIRLVSDNYSEIEVSLDDIELRRAEKETTKALVKGVVSGFLNRNYKVGGFCAYITSDVLIGAGLSSSAAFETVIGTIVSGLYNDMKVSAVDIAIIGHILQIESQIIVTIVAICNST